MSVARIEQSGDPVTIAVQVFDLRRQIKLTISTTLKQEETEISGNNRTKEKSGSRGHHPTERKPWSSVY